MFLSSKRCRNSARIYVNNFSWIYKPGVLYTAPLKRSTPGQIFDSRRRWCDSSRAVIDAGRNYYLQQTSLCWHMCHGKRLGSQPRCRPCVSCTFL